MTIGQNIRKYRKAKGITQEVLAEKIGLTPSAVSQWETDRVMPDITQLPLLCNAFAVTADELLGIDTRSRERMIDEIIEEANDLCQKNEWGKACSLLRKALEEYPDSYELMSALAFDIQNEKYPEFNDDGRTEQIELFEKILAGSDNDNLINTTVGALCAIYAREGRVEDAKGLLKHIPYQVYSYKDCLLISLGGTMEWVDEACLQINEHFHAMINLMCQVGKWVEYAIGDEEILKVWEKVENMVKFFYEDGDYQLANTYLLEKYFWMALRYTKLQRKEEALLSLEKMIDLLEKLEREQYRERSENREVFYHTSVLSRKVSSDKEPFWTGLYEPYFYYQKMKDVQFDAVRTDPRFCAVYDRLREMVGEEE